MENRVTFDYSKAMQFIGENEITSIKAIAETAKNILVEKSGAGNDFLGWIDLPVNYDKEEFARSPESCRQDQKRQRRSGSDRHRRFLSGSQSCHRVPAS